MTPRVFAVQMPTKLEDGEVVPSMDLSPATEWGRLQFLLGRSVNPFRDLQNTAALLRHRMESEHLSADDYLLLVGNPTLIGLAAALAVERCGVLRTLQWQRTRGVYQPNFAQVSPPVDGAMAKPSCAAVPGIV